MIHDTLITYFISQKLRRYIPLINSERKQSFDIDSYCLRDLSYYLDENITNDRYHGLHMPLALIILARDI